MTVVAVCFSILLCLAILLLAAYTRGIWLNLRAREFVTTYVREAEADARRKFNISETFYTKNIDVESSEENNNLLYSLLHSTVAFVYNRRSLIPFYQEPEDNSIEVVYPEETSFE